MGETSPREGRRIDWSRWLGYILLAVVAAAIAKPVFDFIELMIGVFTMSGPL